ncbi:MAG: ABC transporter ATP-binding protein [Candidatus Omnitrophica bacterium]|nr:ABC transporter ATP-binding protein [Candidatus Omnitrophota bacterium]
MLLELKKVKKYFPLPQELFQKEREYVRAVDNVDLTINAGENLGLVGESGSGKTTLGRIILKLYPATEGAVFLEGKDITSLSNKEMRPLRKNIQMVFQDPYSSLDPRCTIRNVLNEAFVLEGKVVFEERIKRMKGVLRAVGLSVSSLDKYPHEFSGGERQRIAIARALIMNPKLLILDEAVSSLDVLIQEQVIDLLKELQDKYDLTYLFITHNLRVVRKLCQKIAVMYKGKIVELAGTEEVFSNPIHPYTKKLLAAALDYKANYQEDEFEIK